jgi:polar amino acid transport system substrate-binding protein
MAGSFFTFRGVFGGTIARPRAMLAGAIAVAALISLGGGMSSRAAEPLRVGMELAYPPFEMTDTQGRPAGVSVQIAEALGEHLGRPVVIENIAFDGLIPALKTRKIDCIISSMTATPERARSIAFSDPYLKTGLAILAAADADVSSIADLDKPGRTIAVKKGTTAHQFAAREIRRGRVLVLDREAAAVMEVVQQKADAFLYDPLSIYQHHQRHPETTSAILKPFREEAWAVGLRRGDDQLLREINAFLKAFRSEGGFARLGDQFFAEEKAYFEARDIPFLF